MKCVSTSGFMGYQDYGVELPIEAEYWIAMSGVGRRMKG